jgi:diguanylate cyclase (GGDEF)-like protein
MNIPATIPSLDLFTAKVMTLVTVLIVSFAALFAWRINGRVAGMRLFALGLLTLAFGGVLGICRVFLPGNSMILLACNLFMVGGVTAMSDSIRAFRGFPRYPRKGLAVCATILLAFYLYWLLGHDSFGLRIGVVSAALALSTLDSAASMLRRVPSRDRGVYWPTGCAFGFAAAYLIARAIGGFSGSYGDNAWSPVPLELATTICADVAIVGCVFGMLLASNAQLAQDAQRMALYDPLTNLPNRRLFLERLLEAERRALATGRQFGVIYLDLDGFKLINDTLGHDVGDELLGKVSASMSRVLRSGDCLGRLGGDEFVVLVGSVENRAGVSTLAERLKAVVESEPVRTGYPSTMRISCGIALFPEDGRSGHDVMREADVAMYHAKRRSRVVEQRRSASGPNSVGVAATTINATTVNANTNS